MQFVFPSFLFILVTVTSYGQKIISGDFDSGLKVAYDTKLNKLTGYFESYSGWDEDSKNPKFSCIFYFEGLVKENNVLIKTYYPGDQTEYNIDGLFEIIDNKTVKIKLPTEHGGCWNVQHFADEPVSFQLNKMYDWIQIRYIASDKAFFYSDKSAEKKLKSYLVKKDIVCIEKIEGDWAYCLYDSDRITKGWVRIEDLNKIN